MKKTFSLLVLFLLVVTGAFAQRSVAMREVHGIRFVVPTIDLLIRYAEQDFEAWKKEMSSLGLTCMSDDADAPIYQQGKPGEMVLAIGKTRKGVTFCNRMLPGRAGGFNIMRMGTGSSASRKAKPKPCSSNRL